MHERTCANCPWWSRFPEQVEFRIGDDGTQLEIRSPNERGECRRQPPQFKRDFPMTDSGDWCGEHPERRLSGDVA